MCLLPWTLGLCVLIYADSSYASCEYDVTYNHTLPTQKIKLVKQREDGLSLLDTCKRWCDLTDTCLSLDYNKGYGLCYLSHLTKDTDPTESFRGTPSVDYYEKSWWCYDDAVLSLPVYSEECRPGWQYNNGSCYYVQYNYRYDWHKSKSLCEAMDAHLATVHSAEELHFLGVAINRVDFESESGHNGEYWVGAIREEHNKPFIWTDGTILPDNSSLWKTNHPSYYFYESVGIKADWDLGEREDGSFDVIWAANGLFTEDEDEYMTYICEYELGNEDEGDSWWSWLG